MNKFFGLLTEEVEQRTRDGLTNRSKDKSSRSIVDILRSNILTRFNAILTVLALVVIIIDRSPLNALFGIAMVINSGVGIFQELRAKATLDKLSILNAPTVKVIRNGKVSEINLEDIVIDDLIKIDLGDQIVVDGQVLHSEGLEVDESLLTGESDSIFKKQSDSVLSGSSVVAGFGVMRAEKVGADSYSSKLASQAKAFKRASSELVSSTNKLLKWISWTLILVVPVLVFGQLRVGFGDWQQAIIHSTAAIVGMIPEGLVLLTSAAFMLAVIQLAKRQVLVQQLPAVETLARVDTLLLDKTGTLTEGDIRFEAVVLHNDYNAEIVDSALATIASRAQAPTNIAIAAALKDTQIKKVKREIAFNSSRKWSAIEISGDKWLFGAPEVIFSDDKKSSVFNEAQRIASTGKRVLALVKLEQWPDKSYKISEFEPAALVVLSEKIRDDARQTLEFFSKQKVDIKIISGDSPLTVAAVAQGVGMEKVRAFDARELPNPDLSPKDNSKFKKIIKTNNVFGRVQPEQKRQICSALQEDGRIVAMTGDGVNDALALKKADLGIAMNSGSAATKAVAEIVLLDNKFSRLPKVLSEGRRVIANIERVANLFVIKNVYSLLLALAVTIAAQPYPYLPSQMTVISSLSIGIPAFFLALAPNEQIYRPGFLGRVLKFAIPVGFTAAFCMMMDYLILENQGIDMMVIGTSISIVMMMIGLWTLVLLARPLRGWKVWLISACGGIFTLMIMTPPIAKIFRYNLDLNNLPITLGIGFLGMVMVWLIHNNQDSYGKMLVCLRSIFKRS